VSFPPAENFKKYLAAFLLEHSSDVSFCHSPENY